MNAEQAWQATLGQLQMEMSKAAYDTWVRDACLLSHEGDECIIGVKNAYICDWLEEQISGYSVKEIICSNGSNHQRSDLLLKPVMEFLTRMNAGEASAMSPPFTNITKTILTTATHSTSL